MPLTALVVLILQAPASFAAAPAARHDCKSGMVYVHRVAYATIQDAVDAAPEGTTVRICEGTYFENVVVDSDVTLEGAGADRTIVDGSEDGSVVRVDGADVDLTIRGLTLQHGTAESGGGISAPGYSGSLTLSGVVVRDNTAGSGGGVYSRVSVVADDDTVITDNVADYGGGVFGGGAGVWGGPAWYGGRIESNDAGVAGGGMDLDADEGEVRHVAIVGNHSDEEAGGIFLSNACTLRDASVTDNTADSYGGGLYVFNYGAYSMGRGNGVTVRNSVITGNVAGHGGGAYVRTRLNSIDTDWGEGELDNGPDDVYFVGSEGLHDHHQDPAAYTGFGDGADFTCFQHEGVCE